MQRFKAALQKKAALVQRIKTKAVQTIQIDRRLLATLRARLKRLKKKFKQQQQQRQQQQQPSGGAAMVSPLASASSASSASSQTGEEDDYDDDSADGDDNDIQRIQRVASFALSTDVTGFAPLPGNAQDATYTYNVAHPDLEFDIMTGSVSAQAMQAAMQMDDDNDGETAAAEPVVVQVHGGALPPEWQTSKSTKTPAMKQQQQQQQQQDVPLQRQDSSSFAVIAKPLRVITASAATITATVDEHSDANEPGMDSPLAVPDFAKKLTPTITKTSSVAAAVAAHNAQSSTPPKPTTFDWGA
jgi:hypothetical protein